MCRKHDYKGKNNKGHTKTMGMAASQVRLLTLTSRLHDVEYAAQNIESQKIALATQKDELYQNYCDALDAKKIQVKFYNGPSTTYVDANFSTLCGWNPDRVSQYSLRDANTGKVIVDEDTAAAWEFCGNDKYSFAWEMLGMEGQDNWQNPSYSGQCIGSDNQDDCDFVMMTEVEQAVYDKHKDDSQIKQAREIFDEVYNKEDSTTSEKKEALETFRDKLYSLYSTEIYAYMRINKQDSLCETNKDPETAAANKNIDQGFPEDFPADEFNYYVRLWESINEAGGCQVIDPQYVSGDEANTWFNNMVSSGRVLIDLYNPNKKEWTETSVATSTNANNLQETQDDTDLKKAEAQYEYELDVINRKDTKFDNQLSKLETERSAITTEIESIDKVKGDNIERTFGIFS